MGALIIHFQIRHHQYSNKVFLVFISFICPRIFWNSFRFFIYFLSSLLTFHFAGFYNFSMIKQNQKLKNENTQSSGALLPNIKIPTQTPQQTSIWNSLITIWNPTLSRKLKEKTEEKISPNMKNTQNSKYHDRA